MLPMCSYPLLASVLSSRREFSINLTFLSDAVEYGGTLVVDIEMGEGVYRHESPLAGWLSKE